MNTPPELENLLPIAGDSKWQQDYAARLSSFLAGNAPAPPPYYAIVMPTSRCQSGCSYCDAWKYAGTDLPFQELCRFISEFAEMGGMHVCFGGGEPLLYPRLMEALKRCRDEGMSTALTTNGLDPDAEMLTNAASTGLSLIALSIDSLRPDVYKRLRGAAVEQVMRTADILQKIREDHPLCVMVLCTLSAPNIEDAVPVLDFAQERGWGIVYQPVHLTRSQRKRSGWLLPDERALERMEDVMSLLVDRIDDGAMICSEPLYLQHVTDFFRRRRLRFAPCLTGSVMMILDAEGSLRPCWAVPGVARTRIGNAPLGKIWQSRRYRIARQLMLRVHCPGCWYECYADQSMKWASRMGLPLAEGIRGGM